MEVTLHALRPALGKFWGSPVIWCVRGKELPGTQRILSTFRCLAAVRTLHLTL